MNLGWNRLCWLWIGVATLVLSTAPASIAGSGKLALGECKAQNRPQGSWASRYCGIRQNYLDLVIMGNVATPDLDAIERIEGVRQQCVFREEASDCVSKQELQETIANLRKTALPTLIEEMGHYDGSVQFRRRVNELIDTFDFLCREPCNAEAVRAYTTRLPVLLK